MIGTEHLRPLLMAAPRPVPRRAPGRPWRMAAAAAAVLGLVTWLGVERLGPGVTDVLSATDVLAFEARKSSRLNRYRAQFEAAAERHGLGWRWLAAIAYQESQWRPDAVSRTGVRGLMMLTRVTAGDMGIDNRRDPGQSIDGGARYLRWLLGRVPAASSDDTRLALALASYHAGPGRVQSAWQASGAREWREFATLVRGDAAAVCRPAPDWHCALLRGSVHYVERVRAFRDRL